MIVTVAKALGELVSEVVFVGGAAVSFYLDTDLGQPSELTNDIDCVVEVINYGEFQKLENKLQAKGFRPSLEKYDGQIICRKKLGNLKVDFMPTDAEVLSFGNPWFADGYKNKVQIAVGEFNLWFFNLPYFVASKLEAFNSRGEKYGDIRESKDLEDIALLLNGCNTLEEQVLSSDENVKVFIVSSFNVWLNQWDIYSEALMGALPGHGVHKKLDKIHEKLSRLSDSFKT